MDLDDLVFDRDLVAVHTSPPSFSYLPVVADHLHGLLRNPLHVLWRLF